MNRIRRAFADLSVGQVHYAACGDPQARAVLLLHQSPRSWREYRAVLPLLGLRWHAIAMDTAGFGDSEGRGSASIAHYAQVALELVEHLGLAQVHVVGHHTGGVIAVELAAAAPQRVASLTLSSTPFTDAAFRAERATRPPIDEVPSSADGGHLAALWQRRQSFYPADRPDLLQAFVRDALAVDDPEAGHRAVASYRMEERVGHIRQPVCILRATHDPFAAPHAADWVHRLPQAQLFEIEGGMVPLPDQMPEQFAEAVDRFLSGLSR
ncbi:MAG TPA: alpha/beta hydrolase [Burkholderiaceae bacterium]|nr:alpha/beta hydrolase [Burkholderiaceae bacterium]